MNLLIAIVVWAVFGLICGAIARLLVPGRQSMGLVVTMLLGVIGSFVGGFLAFLIVGGEPLQATGFIFSVIGAVIALALYLYAKRGSARGAR